MTPNILLAAESIEFGTGDKTSASWQFVNELALDWQNVNYDENSLLSPRYYNSDEKKFNALEYRQLRFVIAPMNALTIKELKQKHLKVVSTLWNVYLAPMVTNDSDLFKGIDSFENWYIPKGSRIIPSVYFDKIKEYHVQNSVQKIDAESDEAADEQIFDQDKEDNDAETSDLKSNEGFSEPLTIEELLAQSQPHEIKPTAALQIQLFDAELLKETDFLTRNDLLFFEMTGSVSNLKATLGSNVVIRRLNQDFFTKLQNKLFWLEPFKLNINKSEKMNTVGMTMVLYTHEAESQVVVRKLLKLLISPKKLFFPPGYIFKNIRTSNTKKLPRHILHDASLIQFKK